MTIKHCTECGEAFGIGIDNDWADVLDHWARHHNDTEVFWSVVGEARTWTRCGGCGEIFPSEIRADDKGLSVDLYCEDCADDGLEDKIKGLMVEDVSARYVLENEIEDCEGEGTDAAT